MDGTEISRRLWEMLNEQSCNEVLPNGDDVMERVGRGDLVPVTRSMLAQVADALGKCCDGGACPLDNTENTAPQRIVDAINNKDQGMEPSRKAKNYLRLTEGSEKGNPEGTPVEYIEAKMKKVHLEGMGEGSVEMGVPTIMGCMAGVERVEALLDAAAMGSGDPSPLLDELAELLSLLGKLYQTHKLKVSDGQEKVN